MKSCLRYEDEFLRGSIMPMAETSCPELADVQQNRRRIF